MPCWGREGLDVVSALAGQMFPVLDGHYTYVTWLLVRQFAGFFNGFSMVFDCFPRFVQREVKLLTSCLLAGRLGVG